MAKSMAEMQAEIDRLTAENQQQKQELTAKLRRAVAPKTLKVSAKGGASLYGLGRWPVTLYRSQWEELLAMTDDIRTFLVANRGKLSEKPGNE